MFLNTVVQKEGGRGAGGRGPGSHSVNNVP